MSRKKFALLLAGGSGRRAGSSIPKQFHPLGGRPLLWWSIKAFRDEDPQTGIILVMNSDFLDYWKDLFNSLPEEERFDVTVVEGGASRTDSSINGLRALTGASEDDLVAIHDGARPLIDPETIRRGWKEAESHQAAIPVVPMTDSLRELSVPEDLSSPSSPVDRSRFVAVQTPQFFRFGLIGMAYENLDDRTYTDDASVVARYAEVHTFFGNPENIKVTNPQDFAVAEVLMARHKD